MPLPGRKPQDFTGQRFGRLTALRRVTGRTPHRWLLVCDCGHEHTARVQDLQSGGTTSCGCFRQEVTGRLNATHGHARRGRQSPEYAIWTGVIKRCANPNNINFKNYGGRGIRVCGRWLEPDGAGFKNFYADMGPRPDKQYSIERLDNDGAYTPENCVWGSRTDQACNKRNTIRVMFQGEEHALAALCRKFGLNCKTVRFRIVNLGWPVERALGTPPKRREVCTLQAAGA